jgi:hypothetical protein
MKGKKKKKTAAKVSRQKASFQGEIRVPHWMQPGSTRDLPWRMQKKKPKKPR